MSKLYTKTIKIPISIVHDDDNIKKIQRKYVDDVLREIIDITNYSTQCYLAYKSQFLREEHQELKRGTFLYQRAITKRILAIPASVSTLVNNYVIPDIEKAFKNNSGMPYCRNPRLPLEKGKIEIKETTGWNRSNTIQFQFHLPNFTPYSNTIEAQQSFETDMKNFETEFNKGENFAGTKIKTLNKEFFELIKNSFVNKKIRTEVNKIIKSEKSTNIKNLFNRVKKVSMRENLEHMLDEWKLDYKQKRLIAEKQDIDKTKRDKLKQLSKNVESLNTLNEHGSIMFKSTFSYRDKSQPQEVKKILSGEYILCDSLISKVNGRYYLNLTTKCPVKGILLDKKKICGIDLGVNVPAYVATNFNQQRKAIGHKEDIYSYKRTRRAIRKKQQSQGKKKNFSAIERNWIRNYTQTIAKDIVKFCEYNNCGTIHLEDLSGIKKPRMIKNLKYKSEKEQEAIRKKSKWFINLIWTPYDLKQCIKYQAKLHDIDVVEINPRYTSRRCSKCGYVDKTDHNECRPQQSKFKCIKCDNKIHADYNAAINIASASGDVITNGYG